MVYETVNLSAMMRAYLKADERDDSLVEQMALKSAVSMVALMGVSMAELRAA